MLLCKLNINTDDFLGERFYSYYNKGLRRIKELRTANCELRTANCELLLPDQPATASVIWRIQAKYYEFCEVRDQARYCVWVFVELPKWIILFCLMVDVYIYERLFYFSLCLFPGHFSIFAIDSLILECKI